MTIEQAITELKEDIALYIPTNGTIEEVDRELPDGRLITALEMAVKALEQRDTGKWELTGKSFYFPFGGEAAYTEYQCNSCKFLIKTIKLKIEDCKFCPNCGARMEAENEDRD